jgi:lipopolysaccharide/colanic/teichoic acid biosynthesis glycosyltransferase
MEPSAQQDKSLTSAESVWVERPEDLSKSKRSYERAKRIFDVVLSGLALVILSPVLLLIALIIFIDDPHGNPIYVSQRVGKNGRIFNFYKFRSMCINADQKLAALMALNEADGPAFKIKDDPRITRFGRFIRKTSIDELPQLWNVLKGDMSLVGPRPPIPREVEQYDEEQMQRLRVVPGLTCYWQVQPARNSLSFQEWMDLDLKYIRERSFKVDLMIILKTVWVMVRGEGE